MSNTPHPSSPSPLHQHFSHFNHNNTQNDASHPIRKPLLASYHIHHPFLSNPASKNNNSVNTARITQPPYIANQIPPRTSSRYYPPAPLQPPQPSSFFAKRGSPFPPIEAVLRDIFSLLETSSNSSSSGSSEATLVDSPRVGGTVFNVSTDAKVKKGQWPYLGSHNQQHQHHHHHTAFTTPVSTLRINSDRKRVQFALVDGGDVSEDEFDQADNKPLFIALPKKPSKDTPVVVPRKGIIKRNNSLHEKKIVDTESHTTSEFLPDRLVITARVWVVRKRDKPSVTSIATTTSPSTLAVAPSFAMGRWGSSSSQKPLVLSNATTEDIQSSNESCNESYTNILRTIIQGVNAPSTEPETADMDSQLQNGLDTAKTPPSSPHWSTLSFEIPDHVHSLDFDTESEGSHQPTQNNENLHEEDHQDLVIEYEALASLEVVGGDSLMVETLPPKVENNEDEDSTASINDTNAPMENQVKAMDEEDEDEEEPKVVQIRISRSLTPLETVTRLLEVKVRALLKMQCSIVRVRVLSPLPRRRRHGGRKSDEDKKPQKREWIDLDMQDEIEWRIRVGQVYAEKEMSLFIDVE
ncbi:UNVERIFIED_CONTAM: hypothetical protein HDU68_009678 [Siphonaria sp. JEL0065]|nr:hypothetical protein HDU68_009678 [Siphonaria sp. JEL0065]